MKEYIELNGRLPYDLIQEDVEKIFLDRLKINPSCIIIVGGYLAYEVDRMSKYYPECDFIIFEASKRYFFDLQKRFIDIKNVRCEFKAISSLTGISKFFDVTYGASGSLLKPIHEKQILEEYDVETLALDDYDYIKNKKIDMLWCDVQGNELEVLRGSKSVLSKCGVVFLEISKIPREYKNQCSLAELDNFLSKFGFELDSIGLDTQLNNGTGNALWIK